MQLSLLQSRLVASLAASLTVLLLYWLLQAPSFAQAAEQPLQANVGLNLDLANEALELEDELPSSYEPEFALLGRSIIGRVPVEAVPLSLNTPQPKNVEPNGTACFVLPRSSGGSQKRNNEDNLAPETDGNDTHGERIRRQDGQGKTLYISATTCLQPGLTDGDGKSQPPPQLRLAASTSKDDGCVKSTEGVDDGMWVSFDEGLATLSVGVSDDEPLYVSIIAPEAKGEFSGIYNIDIAVSAERYYYDYDEASWNNKAVLWMDSDSSAALLVSQNLTLDHADTQKIMKMDPPFELYVENTEWSAFTGIKRSRCAMEKQALISANKDSDGRQSQLVRTSMTTRGPGALPKQQFYFEGLNHTSTYRAVLVQVSDYDDGGRFDGRQESEELGEYVVFSPIEFRTLAGTTCKVVTDLEFCSETQYAVPGGGEDLDGPALAKMYDNYARDMYANFEKIMMQIPCETDSTSQYSLARGCDDCKKAYKQWLCTAAIPRCEDYTSNNSFAFVRNVGQPFPNGTMLPEDERSELMKIPAHNSSRNKFIDDEIAPGPYKEVLPCEDLCYEVVQSCPAAMGFGCPQPGMLGFEWSYGRRTQDESLVSCNSPGQARTRISAAETVVPHLVAMLGAVSLSLGAVAFL